MGKQKEATVARSSRSKRKSTDQAAQPEAELQQPKAKKVKKQAEPAAAAEPTVRPKRDQKTSKKADSKPAKKADSKPAKKSDKKPKAAAKPEKKPKRQSKRKQAEAEEVSDADEEEQQQEEPEQSVHDIFMEEVHVKEKELNKHCLIMGQVETDEDETTLEELRALTRVFVPQQVQDNFMELWEELDEVGQDSEEEEEEEDDQDQPDILGAIMKAILGGKMLNTKHSSQMHNILKTHQDQIDKAIKSKGWQKAFCRWAAILMASHREKHWYEDTDCPQDAEAVYKRMQQQWTKLKARSDEELGGLVAEGSKTPKEEFDAYLEVVADDMRNMDYSV